MEDRMSRAVSPSSRSNTKPDAFSGRRTVVLPPAVVKINREDALFAGLLPTDIGVFQEARGHRMERRAGSTETIFIHCLAGAGWCDLEGARHIVRPGELLAIPPGRAHAYGSDIRRPWTIRWFHLTGADLPALAQELGLDAASPVGRPGDDATLALLFDQALSALESGYARAHLLGASRALACYLTHSARLARQVPAAAPDARMRIARCIDFMRLHLDRPLRLGEIAALAHWSPSHFKARFREHTGYGCIDYLIRLRIHAACQLLDTSRLDIQGVAARVGYTDPLWFSKAFKSVTGQAPSEYRSRAKG